MARTRDQWNNEINTWALTMGLSASQFAEWKYLRDLVVGMAMIFEYIFEKFKKDVDNALATKQPGTIYWYVQVSKEYQHGDTLFSNNGIIQYGSIIEAHRIVKQASAREIGVENVLAIKVAKEVGGLLAPLDAGTELAPFKVYMKARRAPGTYLSIVSEPADTVKYTLAGSHDPLFPSNTVNASLLAILEDFKLNFRFDAIFYKYLLAEKLQDVEGFIINALTVWLWDTVNSVWVEITDGMELPAGYFNWDGGSGITLNTL